MGLYQSYQQVFVTNSPALLAEGQTVDNLAVGQVGFLDAKTYKAVTSPTYAKNKALYAVWGTPDLNLGNFSGVQNENEYSKIIKGKLVTKVRAKKAQRGQTPVYTVGWSGDNADTDTLFAKIGESKDLYIRLTGAAITRLYSCQGLTKVFNTTPECINSCSDDCGNVNAPKLAIEIAKQINSDKDFSKFIRVKPLISCDPAVAPVEADVHKIDLVVTDGGDDLALGLVQAQYPTLKVKRTNRVGIVSTYSVIQDSATVPAAFSSQTVAIANCTNCPATATKIAAAKVLEIKVGSSADAPVDADATSITLLSESPESKVYTALYPTTTDIDAKVEELSVDGVVATFVGEKRDICQFPATTVAWAEDTTVALKKREKKYRITLSDSVCGTDRLADLQAAFPKLVISIVDATGDCVHTYETTISSEPYQTGCGIDLIKYIDPELFEGAVWKEVLEADYAETCKAGLLIETAFVNRSTNECTFDYFPYENDVVHVQASNFNIDYNADPCEEDWVFKQIRQVKYPLGHGRYVQELEKLSKMYDQRFRSFDPVVREVQGYSFQADATKFYDQYVIEYSTKWKTGAGWASDYEQSIHLNIFVPEGTGDQIGKTLSSYAVSAGVDEDGVSI